MPSVQLKPATHPATSGQRSSVLSPTFSHYLPGCIEHSPPVVPVAKAVALLDLGHLQSIICTTRKVKRGNALYRTHDPFDSIYTVRAGCFKTVITHRDGKVQVTGFQFMGETLGLDGLCTERHNCDAIALEDSEVSVMRFTVLASLCQQVSSIQHHFYRVLSGEIVRESGHMMMLGTMSAEQRLATFLLDLSDRMKARGYSAVDFNLRMTREEMGNYLGIKLETVSRMFSKLHKQGLVDAHGKQIRIINRPGLLRL